MPHTVEAEFVFTFGSKGQVSTLTVPVIIPLSQSVEDLAGRLIKCHNLPCYVESALLNELEKFVAEKTEGLQDKNAEEATKKVLEGTIDVDVLIDSWTKAFTQEVAEYAKPEAVTNEAVFSEVYHALIHSPALEALLNLEHTYAMEVGKVIQERDRNLKKLEESQSKEMEDAVRALGIACTDEEVNQLAQRHFESTQLMESKCASELSNLQDSQKRQYRHCVMQVHEDTQTTAATPTYLQRVRALSNTQGKDDMDEMSQPQRMEESFTIHLGAQLKTMHNIRLISADILSFCRHKPNKIGGQMVPQPQRLQTAMSLYSNSLCALVLLVDNRLNSYTGIKREFARVCQQSTDFHFPDLEQQFEHIELEVLKANEWRSKTSSSKHTEEPAPTPVSSAADMYFEEAQREDKVRMQQGDFYITRHSNLSEVHIVFHLVVDDSIKSNDITSRHPVILGYRNILKACFRHDIHTITLPLMLVHEMSEEMTIPWVQKRCELVFKCVKGFMMELATFGGQEARTIQFIVPKGLSEETFANISNMLPTIFRMSNPVVLMRSS